MNEMINKQKAIDAIEFEKVYMTAYKSGINEGNLFEQYNKGLDDAIKAITALPSVEPVMIGEWKESTSLDDVFWVCSVCGFCSEASAANILYKYCPNCGAKLTRGE